MRVLATASKGTQRLLAAECAEHGLRPRRVPAHGVELDLDWDGVARALVHLRIAQRVLVHVEQFPCDGAQSLYDGVRAVRWQRFLDPAQTLAVAAQGRLPRKKPRRGGALTNHVFAAQRIKDAICDGFVDRVGARPSVDVKRPDVRIVARFVGDAVSLWLDPAGRSLHLRGYRQQAGEAPLRETLAAALLRFAGWERGRPLVDPMCGAGTIAIEAAQMALGIAPGGRATFGAQRWRHEGAELAQALMQQQQQALDEESAAAARQKDQPPLAIFASDIDSAILKVAAASAQRAGVGEVIALEQADARSLRPPPSGASLICNPPYGERIGGADVEQLYRDIGRCWGDFEGVSACLVDGHPRFRHAFGQRWERSASWSNGPLEITVRDYQLGATNRRGRGRR